MTSGAVQHHFGSKATLMLEVITRLVSRLEEAGDFWPPRHWSLKRRALISASLRRRMSDSFPEMCRGPQSAARVQFMLSALRGMGLVAPFSDPAATPPQLRVLSRFIQSFDREVG